MRAGSSVDVVSEPSPAMTRRGPGDSASVPEPRDRVVIAFDILVDSDLRRPPALPGGAGVGGHLQVGRSTEPSGPGPIPPVILREHVLRHAIQGAIEVGEEPFDLRACREGPRPSGRGFCDRAVPPIDSSSKGGVAVLARSTDASGTTSRTATVSMALLSSGMMSEIWTCPICTRLLTRRRQRGHGRGDDLLERRGDAAQGGRHLAPRHSPRRRTSVSACVDAWTCAPKPVEAVSTVKGPPSGRRPKRPGRRALSRRRSREAIAHR